MNREEFTMEAALRLIVLEPDYPEKAATIAKELAEELFGTHNNLDHNRDEFEKVSIQYILNNIHPKSKPLETFFEENNVSTIGDMLKINRNVIRNVRGIGKKCVSKILDILEYHDIVDW